MITYVTIRRSDFMPREKKESSERGTRNLNGMGNLYFNKKTQRYEYKIMVHGRVRMATGKTAAIVNKRKKNLIDVPENKEKINFYEWVELWLKTYIKPLKKTSTYKQYNDTYKCYIKPNIKNVPLRTVNTTDIQKIISKMNEKGLSAYTMKQARKVLNLALSRALKDKYITDNPVKEIEIPAVQQKARKVLKPEEIQKMFTFLESSRWYWPLRFMLVTGLRRGELLALKWSDIDEDNKVITISDNLTDEGIGTTKSNKIHYVGYSDTAKLCIDGFKEQLKKESNHAIWVNPADLIFVSVDGQALRPKSLNNVFRRVKENAGVDVSPHSLRHTFVYYSKNKLTLSELKDTLGHDASTSTLDIYGDMLFDASKVANKIDKVFSAVKVEQEEEIIKDNIVSFEDYKKRAK